MRLHNGYVEIYKGKVLLARHEAQHCNSKIFWLKGPYKGLTERHGIPGPYLAAHMSLPKVEQRDLLVYDSLLGDVSNG